MGSSPSSGGSDQHLTATEKRTSESDATPPPSATPGGPGSAASRTPALDTQMREVRVKAAEVHLKADAQEGAQGEMHLTQCHAMSRNVTLRSHFWQHLPLAFGTTCQEELSMGIAASSRTIPDLPLLLCNLVKTMRKRLAPMLEFVSYCSS